MESTQLKKLIAKEWLIFVVIFLFGLFILPTMLVLIFDTTEVNARGLGYILSSFYDAIKRHDVFAWSVVLAPYLFVQLARSLILAISTLRQNS